MKKSQKTKTYTGEELKSLFNKNGDAIIKTETLKNVKAIKIVSEATVTDTQFDMLMDAISKLDKKFTKKFDKVDKRLDNIEKDIKMMKNTPTMKKELQATN